MRDLSKVAEKVKSLLIAEGIDVNDAEAVNQCLSECVAPTLAQKAFNEMVDNAPFERIKRTPDENGYHYGLLKEDRPKMPEAQLYMVSTLLDSGWGWWDETEYQVGLNKEVNGKLKFIDVNADGGVHEKSVESIKTS
jgi:hypothetical protein